MGSQTDKQTYKIFEIFVLYDFFLSRAKETLLQMFSFYLEAPLKVIKMKISINQEP